MEGAYIVDIVRTPIGKFGGMLSNVRPDDLATMVIIALLQRNPNLVKATVEEVIWGAANQAGEDNRNVARMASLMAGLPIETAGVTVNRLCASGLQAIIDASRALRLEEGDAFIAGGSESMTRAPFVMAKAETAYSRKMETYDTTIGWRFPNPKLTEMYHPYSMGETAENVARKYKISREEQDEFAFNSQKKYKIAHETGKFADEIIPVCVPQEKGQTVVFEKDEHPRFAPLEKLAALKPAFIQNGTVTAANSSGVNDGAAAALMVNEKVLNQQGLKPKVKIVSVALAGVDPDCMGMGPVPATKKALRRAGLTINDIGLIELNEAFASQSIACINELGLDPEIVNVSGGSIALGHPLGASGARISATLIHEMLKRKDVKYGLATMCVGVGQGAAVIYEKG